MEDSQKADRKALKKVDYDPFSSGKIQSAVPTTEAQREIWATLALDKDATLCYNEALAIDISGGLDKEILNLAFQEVLKRHDALRSIFSSDGKFFFIKEFSPYSLEYTDLSRDTEKNSKVDVLKKNQIVSKFNLQDGPCFKGHLVKIDSDKFLLLVNAHHIICDGWSFAILLTELTSIYSSLKKRAQLAFEPASQFVDYAISEHRLGLNNQHKQFWLNQFSTLPNVKKLPLDFQRPKYRTYNSSRVDFDVSEESVKALKKFGASQGSSFYTVLMAGFQVLLNKISGSNELVVGMASAAQSESGKQDLVGHLVNLLPLRSEIDPNQTFKSFLKSIRSKMLDSFEHQNFSFGSLLKELNVERDPSGIPLVNIVFNIDQQASGQGMRFDDLKAHYSTIPREFENFELFINAVSCENRLVIECQYNTNLFKASTITNWFSCYVELMKMLIESSDSSLSSHQLPNLYIPQLTSQALEVKKVTIKSYPEYEFKLKPIWERVLELNNIKSDDNFFALGGHSLLVIEMLPLIEMQFNKSVSARDIFENPSIAELSCFLAENGQESFEAIEQIPTHPYQASYPVTHNQLQVWYLEEMYPGTVMHNLPSSIRMRFAVDRSALEQTLNILTQRHAALRTVIVIEDGVPVQKVLSENLPQFSIKLELVKAKETEIEKLLNQAASYVFNKEHAPLFQTKLYQLGENDFVFYFMVHHAIWDGWSFDIFFEELNTIYSAIVAKKIPQFSLNPGISYADYSVWLNRSVQTGKFANQLSFWKEKLKGPLPVLELPTDFKRPLNASHEGSTFPFQLTPIQADKLRSYAKSQGTSLFNVLLTAFKVTLARYTNLDDVIVGSPVRARNNPQLIQTIGYFVNTVALRSYIQLSKSFEYNLKLVSATCLEAFDHQALPFQVVLNSVDYPRDSGRTPIFQTFFSYQDVSNRHATIDGHPYVQINIDKASTHTDLDLWIKANDKKIEGAFEFRQDLFESSTIKLFFECFIDLVDNLSEHVDAPLYSRSILPATQSELILKKWNDTFIDSSELMPLHKMFERSVSKFSQKTAVENAKGSYTYAELERKANQVAQGLIKLGVGRGDLVGLSLSRDLDLLVAILGILKSGAGYVPLDPAFPQDRLNYMIDSSKPKVLITETSLFKRFENTPGLIFIDTLLNDKSVSFEAPQVQSELSDTVYVIYTSGSTGDPKGVQISHGALSNFLVSMSKVPGISTTDKLLAVTTLSFDIATLEIYLPLITGAGLFLASGYDVIDGKALKSIIENSGITVMQATPSTWRLLLASGWNGGQHFKVLCGGESFPKDLAHKLLSICGTVWNMYGPTETTVWSTCKKLSLNDDIITIGKPIDNTFTYILDEGLNLAPIGVAGQLYIGGLGLADGYFKRPDLTVERFIPNPFVPGQKMYATGDFARFTSSGELECLGRQDGQVKVRGYRIELGEIESVLSKISSIKENAVITKEVRTGDVRIIAFIVKNGEIDDNVLRETLGQRLPKYMVPSHFVILDDLPKTLNGKIDKKTLGTKFTDPKVHDEVKTHEIVQKNEDDVELTLKSIWREVLGVNQILAQDNFFNVGGNSLLAVQLFSKISQRLSLNIPLSVLLETSDFTSFVQAVKSRVPNQHSPKNMDVGALPTAFSSIVSIKASGHSNPVFCFHSVGGNVLNYISLVPAIPKDRPLIGLQAFGVDGLRPMLDTIEEMAKGYIREMKAIQPQGPYYLSGGSMGGMIALEVAQQLILRGDKIEKLVMFDTFGPKINIQSYDESERNFWGNFKKSLIYRKNILVNKLKVRLLNFLGLPVPIEIRLFDVERNNYKALWKYKPIEYKGDLYLIRAKMKASGWYSDPFMGWAQTIKGKIHTYEIEGTHDDFIESPELPKVFSRLI